MKKMIFAAAFLPCFIFAQDIKLPNPDLKGGKPLMECFTARKTDRNYTGKKLTPKQLSNIFYAAAGINRPAEKKLVIPTARNWQDLVIYAALPDGLYQYIPATHTLALKSKGDFRSELGMQKKMFGSASAVLIYVSDFNKMNCKPADKILYSSAHTGYAQQDVALYCASEGLGNVCIGMFKRDVVARKLNLGKNMHAVLAQLVGTLK